MKSKISIVVPVYNSEEWLEACLDQDTNQTYPNIEIIIVDDNSNDSSPDIIKKYKELYENVTVIENKRAHGVGGARNAGLEHVTGDYVAFLDSDDEMTENFCETLIDIIGDADIAVAGRATYVNGVYAKFKTAPMVEVVDSDTATNYALMGKYSAHPVWGNCLGMI